jgi:hypothetical protein
MKKPIKTLIESAIMSGSLGLVLITLSGTTRTQATVISLVSVGLFMVSSLADRD